MSDTDRQRAWEDRAIQDLLASPQNLEDLLRLASAALVDELDFSRMIPAKQRYVLPDLRKLESDIVVEVPFRQGEHAVWIYILLEHQSEPDRAMPLRLLGYMVELWKVQVRRFEENKTANWRLHPILPVLFYTGTRRWSLPLQLDGLMDLPEVLTKYVPRFETLFLSLQETSDEELSDSALGYGLLALREADAPDAPF